MKSIKSRLVPVLLAGLLAGQVALADSESGDLAASLNRVALATNVEILYSPEVVAEKHAARTAVEGDPDVVLEHLLAGTGLAAQQTSPNVYVIREKTGTKTPLSVARLQAAPQTEQTTRSSQPQPSTIAAGIGALEGRVMDELSGTGLAGATVRLVGTNHQAVTDQRGYFRLGAVSSGSYELEIAYIGASPHIDRIDVSAGEDNVANFTLNPNDRDTIYVYANRSSFLQALNQQRNAENNKTVVSADLLGTFPAETVAEALRRVPGITFVRDAATGEANKVSVRGITSEGINVQLNGMQLQGTGIERAVDLTGFLADNISQITIQKSLLPEYEGTANGGLIEIETKSALDYGKRYFSVGVEREFGTESEFGDENQFNLSGVMQLSDTFAVGVSGQLRNSDRRNVGVTISDVLPPVLPEGFTSSFLLPFTFNFPYDAEFDDRLITNSNYLIRDREVENWTGSAFAAWDLGESTRLRAEVQHINNDTVTDLQRSTNQTLTGALTMPIPELGGAERRRSYIRALRPTNGASTIDETTKTDVFSIRGESFLNQWTLNYSAGLTKTSRETFSSTVNTLSDQNTDVLNLLDTSSYTLNPDANGTDRIVDGAFGLVGDGIPQLALSQAGRDFYTSPDTYYVTSASNNVRFNETENLALKLNARYDLADSWLRNIKFGVQYNDIERSNSDDILSNTNIPTSTSFIRLGTTRQFLSEFGADTFQLVNLDSIGAGGTVGAFVRQGSARSIFSQIQAFNAANPGAYRFTNNNVSPEESSAALSGAVTTEALSAGFIQGEVGLGNVTITGGFRLEFSDFTGSAISLPSVRLDTGSFVDRSVLANAGYIGVFDNSGETDKVLPSLVATWRPNDQWVGRFAYNRTIFNPSLQAINRPQQYFIDLRTTQNRATIREGNPNLDPKVNDNFELGVDYYFDGRPAYLKAAVFYKDIENNITNVSLADQPADIEARVRDYLAPLEAQVPGILVGLNVDTEYLLQRPENGDGGSIYGVELEGAVNLDFLPASWPAFFENVQLLGNITWTDAEFATLVSARDENGDLFQLELDRPLAEQAEWAGNFSVAYETGGFSSRLLYTYQAERVTSYDEFNLNTVVPEIKTLDFIATYTGDWGESRYTFFVEADNLLEGAKDAIIRNGTGSFGGEGSPDFFFPDTLLFDGGRTFTVGMRASF